MFADRVPVLSMTCLLLSTFDPDYISCETYSSTVLAVLFSVRISFFRVGFSTEFAGALAK